MEANGVLQGLVARDTIREVIEALTPKQALVAWLRLEGLNDRQIAEILGTSRAAIGSRMTNAGRAVGREMPELAMSLAGRKRSQGNRGRPDHPLLR